MPEVVYKPGLLVGVTTFDEVRAAVPFKQNEATMYGKTIKVPRLEAWFGLRAYRFGGRVEQPAPMPEIVRAIRDRVCLEVAGSHYDSCFANLYRDGDDCIAWHADDDDWIGEPIASVSFGAARRFVLKHNETGRKIEWALGDGDLLVMLPGTQAKWKHQVPRERYVKEPRINLTFRSTKAS